MKSFLNEQNRMFLMLSDIEKIKKELLKELKEEIKKDVLASLLDDKLILTDAIIEDIDIEELVEHDMEDALDLELWVKNIYAIFQVVDESEELSLETLNEKFRRLLDISAALVAQIRVIHENIHLLDEALKGSEGRGILGNLVKKMMNTNDNENENESNPIYM